MPELTEAPASDRDPRGLLDDGETLYEVVDGVVIEKETMGVFASWVGLNIVLELLNHVGPRRLGTVINETLIILDPARGLKRRPDVVFVGADRWPVDEPVPLEGDWAVVPTIAVEVISPRETDRTIQHKLRDYLGAGVRQVWLVRPLDESVTIVESLRSSAYFGPDDAIEGIEWLPGLRLAIKPLFRRTRTGPIT